MEFNARKLPREAAIQLIRNTISGLKPFALMPAPVYFFFQKNEKFIGIRGPLDFFTTEEVEKMKAFEAFYFPPFIEKLFPCTNAAASIKALLTPRPELEMPISPYELSDAVLRILSKLWGKGLMIEPFFVAMFVESLCEPLSPHSLQMAREKDISFYEKAVFGSSWAVFLALHLGLCDLALVNAIRQHAFDEIAYSRNPGKRNYSEVEALLALVKELLEPMPRTFLGASFSGREDRVSQKLVNRLQRVDESLVPEHQTAATIYGPEGFRDV